MKKNLRIRLLQKQTKKPTVIQLREQLQKMLEDKGIKESLQLSVESWCHRGNEGHDVIKFRLAYWLKGIIRSVEAYTPEALVLQLEMDLAIVDSEKSDNKDISL